MRMLLKAFVVALLIAGGSFGIAAYAYHRGYTEGTWDQWAFDFDKEMKGYERGRKDERRIHDIVRGPML